MAATVATKVWGTVITSSPGPMPAARNARCSALVPELTAMPWAAPLVGRELPLEAGDLLAQHELAALQHALDWRRRSRGLIAWYCAFRSRNGILTGVAVVVIQNSLLSAADSRTATGSSTGRPRCRMDSVAASRICTTRSPACAVGQGPLAVLDAVDEVRGLDACRASVVSSFGAHMSPVR